MITRSTNMDYEQCQDLSDLAWFEKRAQPWGAAEIPGMVNSTLHTELLSPEMAYESSADYNLNDFDPFYTISRSDSMEELKRVAAPMEVAPMLHSNTTYVSLPVSNLIKTEYNDEEERNPIQTEEKLDTSFLKMDPDMLLLDTPDLLSELGGCDLIDYIISEGPSLKCDEPTPTVDIPAASSITSTKIEAIKATPTPEIRTPFIPQQQNHLPSQRIQPPDSPPPLKKKKAFKETYLAIPRKVTSGSNDKKIPKMLILKTEDTSTINLHDLGISIAERIKTIGKRPRPKRFSENSNDDEDDDDEDYKYEIDDISSKRKNKRARRLSSSSSTSLSDRYRELRDKNNEASRKSRQNRKEKEKDLSTTLDIAERENMKLKARSDELEKLVLSLRKLLLQIVINKGSSR